MIKLGHWYGHYDSRGGTHLILGAPSDKEALRHYVENAFLVTKEDSWYEDTMRNVADNLLRVLAVRIFGEYQYNEDLLYGETERAYALVEEKNINYDEGEPCCEDKDHVLEIWIGDKENMPKPDKDYALANMGFFGEDAFGMIVQDWEAKDGI